ncbi:MAG: bifunctional ADP-heptose synthase [Chloroflexota bacterium]
MKLDRVVETLTRRTILVVGDVFLDDYLIGRAERLSREAPVPVLDFRARRQVPGGGANPAMNLAALGATVCQIGVVGDDAEGEALRDLLTSAGVDASGLIADAARPTTTKLRVMAEGELRFPQQLARIDRQSREPLADSLQARLVAELERLAATRDPAAILFSDYRAGLITPGLVDAARAVAGERGLLLAADTQGSLDKYQGFGLLKCNRAEAEAYFGKPLVSEPDFESALAELNETLNVEVMLITRGAQGISVGVKSQGHTRLPATNISEVYDVTCAGDTAIAVATLARASGADPLEAAQLANVAAGLVVRRWGNAVVTREELKEEIRKQSP